MARVNLSAPRLRTECSSLIFKQANLTLVFHARRAGWSPICSADGNSGRPVNLDAPQPL